MFYRIEHTKEDGILMWIESPCGFKQPLIRWADTGAVRQFAEALLAFCNNRMKKEEEHCAEENEDEEVKAISDKLLRQALGDDDQVSR